MTQMKYPIVAAAALACFGACLLSIAGETRSSDSVFEGCAMPLEPNHDFLTLCEPHNRSLLRGVVEKAGLVTL